MINRRCFITGIKGTKLSQKEVVFLKKSNNRPTKKSILEKMELFKGEIFQRPPSFSAIKINGVRSYKLARLGTLAKLNKKHTLIL